MAFSPSALIVFWRSRMHGRRIGRSPARIVRSRFRRNPNPRARPPLATVAYSIARNNPPATYTLSLLRHRQLTGGAARLPRSSRRHEHPPRDWQAAPLPRCRARLAPLWCAAVQMIVSKVGASAPTISLAFLSPEAPVTRIQPSAPWIALRLASDCRMPSGVWPTSMTVSGSCCDDFEPAGPTRVAQARADRGFDPAPAPCAAARACSHSRNRVTAMAAVVELNRAGQAQPQRRENHDRRTGRSKCCA